MENILNIYSGTSAAKQYRSLSDFNNKISCISNQLQSSIPFASSSAQTSEEPNTASAPIASPIQ